VTLLKRILAEKRAVVVPLGLAALLNVAAYALVVYPLGVKSAGAADRAMAAARALEAAERDQAVARDLVTAKSRAEQALTTFYLNVLPADLSAARRMTYAHLPALARRTRVKYEERRFEVEQGSKTARLGHLRIRMVLQCEYESFRQFIYELETTPEFIIIDDLTLSESEANKPLNLTLELSTYYRLGANGT
jgi:hypothetical protein